MRSRSVPMTRDEFRLQPFDPAWKQSWKEGVAQFTPRPLLVYATLPLTNPPFRDSDDVRIVRASDQKELTECFHAAFADSFEYCDYSPGKIRGEAKKNIAEYFGGQRGEPLDASRVTLDRTSNRPTGAALFTGFDAHVAKLEMLFVHPKRQRTGLATRLVAGSLHSLAKAGYQTLLSTFMLGNQTSRRWHQRFGFNEEPDLQLATLHLKRLHSMRFLQQHASSAAPAEEALLGTSIRHWETEVTRLESALAQGRDTDAYAWMRFRIFSDRPA